MINYQKILNKNIINVLKDILIEINKNNFSNNIQLYITFITNHKKNIVPNWLLKKYPNEMTIVLQHEYSNINIDKDCFSISLSFENIKTNLKINFESIISFADPSSNFGLKLHENIFVKKKEKLLKDNKKNKTDNVINFSNYKKN